MNYFEVINRVERILGRTVTADFSSLSSEFQLNIKALVNQVNKDVLMEFPQPCRERATTLSISAETSEYYSAVTNSISGEISSIYDTSDSTRYSYNPSGSDFVLGEAGQYEYTFRNNKILFSAYSSARSLTIEYYTDKLALEETAYEDFIEGTTTEKENLVLETDYSILPSFLHEPILVYGTCFYFEAQKNESQKVGAYKAMFEKGLTQLNSHNRSEEQELRLEIGYIARDLRRDAV